MRHQTTPVTLWRPPVKPRCICDEPFWAIYPPPCPAHPDREFMEVTW